MEQLKNRDYYLVIDKSGSMDAKDTPSGQSRWKYVQESATAIANKLAEFDPDGITVVPFAGTHKWYPNTTPEKVNQIFVENSPMGGTTLAPALQACFDDYSSLKAKGQAKANGAIIVVLTDGQPSDEAQVAKSIVQFTKKLDNGDGEFGIAMLQVGKDPEATAFLKRLDDNLVKEGAKFDIVDTKTMEELENIGLVDAIVASLED
jgi:uncharacterized protein YegL